MIHHACINHYKIKRFVFSFRFISNVQNMARMMDSLILNDFPPYTFTKITTTHRPTRTTGNGIGTAKLLNKSTANIPQTVISGLHSTGTISSSVSNLNNNGNVSSGGMRTPMQRPKIPTQGMD